MSLRARCIIFCTSSNACTQERANRECLAHIDRSIAKTSHSVMVTDVDLANEMMRRISKELQHFCADILFAIAKHTCGVKGSYAGISTPIPTPELKCTHDSIADPCTGEIFSPHFVADCTNLCKYLADLPVKAKFGDAEPQLYEVLSVNAVKAATRSEKNVLKAIKVVAQATQKAQQAAAKAVKSGAKTDKAKVNATAKSLQDAKVKLIQAQAAAKTAAATSTEAAAKAAQARTFAHGIVQSWLAEFGNLPASTSAATAPAKPECLETFQLYVPPCSQCKGSQCKCT